MTIKQWIKKHEIFYYYKRKYIWNWLIIFDIGTLIDGILIYHFEKPINSYLSFLVCFTLTGILIIKVYS